MSVSSDVRTVWLDVCAEERIGVSITFARPSRMFSCAADQQVLRNRYRRYHDDHQPPHFHARYQGKEIQVGIGDGRVKGEFPPRATALVLEWWSIHREELEANWKLMADGKLPNPIAPLE